MQSGTSTRNYIEQFFREQQITIQPEYDVSTMPMIMPMLESNMGLGFVPPYFARNQLKRKTAFQIELIERLPPRQICLCTDDTYPQSFACREFIRRLLE